MQSVEFAIKFTAGALIQAKDSIPAYTRDRYVEETDLRKSTDVIAALEKNLKVWKAELDERELL